MSDAVETVEQPQPQLNNPFEDSSWVSTPTVVATEQKAEDTVTEVKTDAAPVVETKTDDEIVDANEYLKTNLGYESWDAAKKEIEELRQLREQKPQEFKFENETSEKFFNALKEGKEAEIYNYLHQKTQLEKVQNLDITDPKNAAELIRLNLQLKYKDLSNDEIHDLFYEQYEKPSKPAQTLEQTDEEYQMTLDAWQARVNAIDRKMVRDAKMVKPEVQQFSQKLTLPDIPVSGQTKQQEPTQEELAAFKAQTESFIKSAEAAVNGFNDYSVSVKNNDVDLSVKYGFSTEEKAAVSGQLKQFAETGFDANALFSSRWLSKDGNINVEQVVKDLSLLNNGDKITQKFVTEAANQRLEAYIKGKKNVAVAAAPTKTFEPNEQKTESEKLGDWVWSI